MQVYLCMYVYGYTCVHVPEQGVIHAYMCWDVNMSGCPCFCMLLYVCMSIHVYTCIFMDRQAWACMWRVHRCVSVHMYIYRFVHECVH